MGGAALRRAAARPAAEGRRKGVSRQGAAAERGGAVEVLPVRGRAALERFIRLPHALMRDDPAWVPPLAGGAAGGAVAAARIRGSGTARRRSGSRGAAGATSAGSARRRTAWRRPTRTARGSGISACSPPRTTGRCSRRSSPRRRVGLAARGLRRVRGPFSLSINEQTGLLVSGFDTPPMLMMPHDPPYAGPRLEALGYRKARDLLAYIVDADAPLPPGAAALVARGLPSGVALRPMRRAALREEVAALIAHLQRRLGRPLGLRALHAGGGGAPGGRAPPAAAREAGLVRRGAGRAGRLRGLPAQPERGHSRPLRPAAALRLGAAAVAAEGRRCGHRARAADGRAAAPAQRPARPRAALLPRGRAAAGSAGDGHPPDRDVLGAGGQRPHAPPGRGRVAAQPYKTYRVYERDLAG